MAARPIFGDGGLHAFFLRGNHRLRYGRGRVASRFLGGGCHRPRDAALDGRERRFGAEQAERPEAVGRGNLSLVRQAQDVHRGRVRGSEVQGPRRDRGSGGRGGLALEGRRQLLRCARECAGEQRIALLHRGRTTPHPEVRRCPGAGEQMAHPASGILRAANQRGVERQDVHRIRRQPHHRAGRRRHVDQGGQRHRLRRLQLRLEIAMIRRVLAARALRAFADGFIAVLLPAYLLALGLGQLEVGFISTATLFGSALATLAVGRWGHRYSIRRLLLGTSLLMAATGLGFAALSSLWPLLLVAFMGPINPSGGDVSVFLPLEHTVLATAAPAASRTSVFARYSFFGSMFGALGALATAIPDWLAAHAGVQMLGALKIMFVVYAV